MAIRHSHCACGAVDLELLGSACPGKRPSSSAFAAARPAATRRPAAKVQASQGANKATVHQRAAAGRRRSCKSSGGALFVAHPSIGVYDVLAATIEDFKFAPSMRIDCGERMIDTKDGLAKFRKAPKALGADDERMKE